jgi:hypothetical protein
MKVKNYLWTLAAALALVGCSDDLETQKGGPEEEPKALGETYVSFTIAQPETKAPRPSGGEDGDGFEAGQENENMVKSLVLYFLDGDANSEAATPILGSLFIGESAINQDKTAPNSSITTNPVRIAAELEAKIEFDKTYGILAVTNIGEGAVSKAATLGELRDEVYEGGAFGQGEAGQFIMSSERIGNIKFSKYNNSENNPATARILVERLAARIDFKQKTEGEANVYPIYITNEKGEYINGDGEIVGEDGKIEMAKITLTNLLVVNQMHSNTYMYKRVAPEVAGDVEWLGLEKADVQGHQTNYVIDPHTKSKTGIVEGTPDNIPYYNRLEKTVNVAEFYKEATEGIKEFNIAGDDSRYNKLGNYATVGYTEENTTDKELQINGYSTGVIFKGTAKVLAAYDRAEGVLPSGYYIKSITFNKLEDNEVFYIYEDKPYKNLETIIQHSVIRADDEGTVANGWYFDYKTVQEALEKATTEEELQTYISSFADNSANMGYRKYMEELLATVDTEVDGVTVTYESVAPKMTWATYKATLTDDELSKYSVRKAVAGDGGTYAMDCYYPYWIKHSDNENPREMGIMEFGIVRNNIYKLAVNKINNFGIFQLDPSTVDEPDQLWMDVELQVKDWVLRYNDNIEL